MKYLQFSQTKLGSNDLLRAHGWAGQAQYLLSWRRANDIGTASNSAEKRAGRASKLFPLKI